MAGLRDRNSYAGGGSDDQGTITQTSCIETAASSDHELLVQPSKMEELLQKRLDNRSDNGARDPFQARGSFLGIGNFMTACFYPVFKLWGGEKTAPSQQPADLWEIPFSDIKELFFVGSGSQGAVFMGEYRGQQLAIKKVTEEKQTDILHLRHLKHPNVVSFV